MIPINWHTESRVVNDLIPYADNPRKLTEKQYVDLKRSLERFDLAEIPAINTDNTIIAGHMRLKILQQLGRGTDTIDVRVPNRKLTEKELQEYNIRSNKNTGEWDFELLANAFEQDELLDWGFKEWELMGFDGAGNDANKEWTGMPEYDNKDMTPARTIHIHFQNEADVREFAGLLGRNITDKTRYLWFPERESE